MGDSNHETIRNFMKRESTGQGTPGRRMILNPRTGKFEIISDSEPRDPDAADVTAEDMKSFGSCNVA